MRKYPVGCFFKTQLTGYFFSLFISLFYSLSFIIFIAEYRIERIYLLNT